MAKDGSPVALLFPYEAGGGKGRSIERKQFWSEGDMSKPQLFGRTRFTGGTAKSVTVYEGELDCLSGFQMLGGKYPAVSVRSASSAKADCASPENHKWLDSFERIYLCFDNDEAGNRAKRAVASLFDFNKVYDVALPKAGDEKWDANKFLEAGRSKDFVSLWWNAKRFLPEGIISSFSDFKDIIDKNKVTAGVSYPFKKLTEETFGIRTGEIVLLTALEGIGKTEIMRAIEYHLLKETEDNIAVIHLEETKGRLLTGLAGYELGVPCHLPNSPVSSEEAANAVKKLIKKDDRLHLYSHFGSSDPDVILGNIRFLASACDCKYVFLDHLSLVVSGLNDDNERKTLDYITTRLAMMVEEIDFSLVFVSHVNDFLQTRGSRNISKVADIWIHADRDVLATNDNTRNTTSLIIKKNRFAGRTGPAGKLMFDPITYKLNDYDEILMPPLEAIV